MPRQPKKHPQVLRIDTRPVGRRLGNDLAFGNLERKDLRLDLMESGNALLGATLKLLMICFDIDGHVVKRIPVVAPDSKKSLPGCVGDGTSGLKSSNAQRRIFLGSYLMEVTKEACKAFSDSLCQGNAGVKVTVNIDISAFRGRRGEEVVRDHSMNLRARGAIGPTSQPGLIDSAELFSLPFFAIHRCSPLVPRRRTKSPAKARYRYDSAAAKLVVSNSSKTRLTKNQPSG